MNDIQECLEQDALRTHIWDALEQLTPREVGIIRRRFGLHGQPEETLRQIGLDLHLSHEQVRQLVVRALATLREHGAGLRDFVALQPGPGACVSHEAQTAVLETVQDPKAGTFCKDDLILDDERDT
jgi:hypothetical protein